MIESKTSERIPYPQTLVWGDTSHSLTIHGLQPMFLKESFILLGKSHPGMMMFLISYIIAHFTYDGFTY
jgi:hypothetical protein